MVVIGILTIFNALLSSATTRTARHSFFVKQIQLTQGKFALVDDKDFEMLSQYKWYAHKSGKTYYAERNKDKGVGKMHRLIMNCPEGMVVDHIDHNGLNNQKVNLRICSHAENNRNSKSRKNSKSQYLGVSLNIKRRTTPYKDGTPRDYTRHTWIAQIETNGKNYNLGRYKTEEEAALAYNAKAAELFGKFANLNIIIPTT